MILNFGAPPRRRRGFRGFGAFGDTVPLTDPVVGTVETLALLPGVEDIIKKAAAQKGFPNVTRGAANITTSVVTENHNDGFVGRQVQIPTGGFVLNVNEYFPLPAHYHVSLSSYIPVGAKFLLMQADGNLVLYGLNDANGGSTAIWASNTYGSGNANHAVFQTDGNWVVYTSGGKAVWATGTNGPGWQLGIGSDGNICVYKQAAESVYAHGPLWCCCAGHGHTATFWSTVLDVVKAIPAIAVAPIALPTAALISAAATPITGDPFKIVTDVSQYAATHPLETIAITAGAAGAAYGVGLIAPTVVAAVSSAGAAGTVGAAGAVVGTGATVAKAAGVLPSGPSTTPTKTPATQPVTPATQPAIQAGMADMKLPALVIVGAAGLAALLLFGKKRGRA